MIFQQVSTGVPGLDAVLSDGGYLMGCPTLLVGHPGCGKTLFLLQFLAEGAREGQRSVCATCSESPERMRDYMRALGHPVDDWMDRGLLGFVDLRPVPGEQVAGAVDQEVVKLRLDAALTVDGAVPPKARLGIDDLNRLAYAFDESGVAQAQTHALFRLLRESGTTTLITAADAPATRDAMVDYAADAVIDLRQTVENRLMTRTLRVVKMRGVSHGTNEYPFMIDADGPALMPVTQLDGHYRSREQMVSIGHDRLDALLGGGLYRGGSLMITGTSGTGKTTLLGQITQGLCRDGLTVVYVTFEQDQAELVHDFAGVGIDLMPHIEAGRARFDRVRSVDRGLEDHLIQQTRMVEVKRPDVLIIDAVTALSDLGELSTVKSMILRLLDVCKSRGVMVIMTELLSDAQESVSQLGLSSLLDAWIRLELFRQSSEYIRLIRVLKGRGACTSQQIKEFRITASGIEIIDPYVGGGTFVFGTEKVIREQAEQNELNSISARLERLRREFEIVPQSYNVRIAQTQAERDEAIARLGEEIEELERRINSITRDTDVIRQARNGS